jgi:hypothetical protein
LCTSPRTFPWYHTLQPLAIPLHPKPEDSAPSNNEPEKTQFRYRYAIHRAGVFHRYEDASDFEEEGADDMDTTSGSSTPVSTESSAIYHKVPIRLLANREQYVVNDVLGKLSGPPDIDHIRQQRSGRIRQTSISTLHNRPQHSRSSSREDYASFGNIAPKNPKEQGQRKKTVGFAPPPPPYHRNTNAATASSAQQMQAAVTRNSSDGLVVVSAFLPVILHRSDEGEWTADWDYEILLSMQTHLRVTRVGVVKWRGWHGNYGYTSSAEPSPEQGVPVSERWKVEECLRPFNCVPVWIDPMLFGAM